MSIVENIERRKQQEFWAALEAAPTLQAFLFDMFWREETSNDPAWWFMDVDRQGLASNGTLHYEWQRSYMLRRFEDEIWELAEEVANNEGVSILTYIEDHGGHDRGPTSINTNATFIWALTNVAIDRCVYGMVEVITSHSEDQLDGHFRHP